MVLARRHIIVYRKKPKDKQRPIADEMGNPMIDEFGQPMMEEYTEDRERLWSLMLRVPTSTKI